MYYSALSHIWTFVTPWPPWRRRSPGEIAVRWGCRLPINNLALNYKSQSITMSEWGLNIIRFNSNYYADVFIEKASLVPSIYLLEKYVRVIPSLPSHLVIHFRFQLSFSNGEVIQMLLASFMWSVGETSPIQ